ncbi:MAG TPA: hypothetical protein VGN72_01195 [Tepidisphaeraceae bacterium]|jgi:hypothetical protein|nr:hypothetical protein [Tepidisphaeraceae bacterium]
MGQTDSRIAFVGHIKLPDVTCTEEVWQKCEDDAEAMARRTRDKMNEGDAQQLRWCISRIDDIESRYVKVIGFFR